MKRILESKKTKMVLSLILIITMLISYVPQFVKASNENESNEYVTFDVQEDVGIVYSEQDKYINYDAVFKNIQTGFKKVRITAESVDNNGETITPTATITSNETKAINSEKCSFIYYESIRTGTELANAFTVKYAKSSDFMPYDKTIKFSIVGEYLHPINGITSFYEEEFVTVTVYPTPVISNFNAQLTKDRKFSYRYDERHNILSVYTPTEGMVELQVASAGTMIGYYVTKLTGNYTVNVKSDEFTNLQTIDINVTHDNNVSGMILSFDEFINAGYSLDNVNGDEVTDANGKTYIEGIEGIIPTENQKAYKYAPTENANGDITFSFKRTASSDEIEDSYKIDKTIAFDITYLTTYGDMEESDMNTYFWNQYGSSHKTIGIYPKVTAQLVADGWDYKVEYNQENNEVEISKNKKEIIDFEQLSEYGLRILEYYPGLEPWARINRSSYIENLSEADFEKWKNNDKLYLGCNDSFEYFIAGFGENNVESGSIELSTIKLSYYSDEGTMETIELNNDTIQLNNISSGPMYKYGENYGKLSFNEYNNAFVGYSIIDDSITYIPQYSDFGTTHDLDIEVKDWKNVKYTDYYLSYVLSYDKLVEAGLSESEIRNIKYISGHVKSHLGTDCEGDLTIAEINYKGETRVSYMELSAEDYNCVRNDLKNNPKTIQISMYKNSDIINNESATVKNVNPTFYIKLSKDFSYNKINAKIKSKLNPDSEVTSMTISEEPYFKYIDNELFLVIKCNGTYDSYKSWNDGLNLEINFYRKLDNVDASDIQVLEAYMITDNENYLTQMDNSYELEKGEEVPDKVFYASQEFQIAEEGKLTSTTKIKNNQNGTTYSSNLTVENSNSISEKENPLVLTKGTTVTYIGELNNQLEKSNNIKMLFRLPVSGNTVALPDEEENYSTLIEEEFKLSEEYITNHQEIDCITEGEPVPQISLVNLENIKVKLGSKVLEPENYTIYYTSDLNSDFDEATYQEYDEVEYQDYIANTPGAIPAKTILIVLNEDYEVPAGKRVRVEYDMTMPEEDGMAGAMFACSYATIDSNGEVEPITILDSEAGYVISGEPGKLVIQKTFKGYVVGDAPTGKSLEGIQFKLKDKYGTAYIKDIYDNDGDLNTEEDLIVTTDEDGKAKINQIDDGTYQLEEQNSAEGYEGIGLTMVEVTSGQIVEVIAENKPLKGNLNIQKTFENTNDIKGNATFTLTRQGDLISYKSTVTTDEEGKVVVRGLEYGTYKLHETSEIQGYAQAEDQIITIDQPEENVIVENKLAKGTLIINKSVPEGETAEGLTFNITGIGLVSYIDKVSGEKVDNNTNLNVTIEENDLENPRPDNITVELTYSDVEPTKIVEATIKIEDLPVGLYTIIEKDIPTIVPGEGEGEIKKFVDVTRKVELLKNGDEAIVDITNKKKSGYLQINKTALFGEGENATEIGDKSQFRVSVTGTSYYGTQVNRVINLDEEGNGIIGLEIGKYNVKEIEVDGYTTYYETNGILANSIDGVEVEITYNDLAQKGNITTQKIQNNLTGVGYVKVIKSLEGIENPEDVISKGIQFKVVGKNAAGGAVQETIIINQIDSRGDANPENDVAYGISPAISVGGEYQLEEVVSTVPDYYEGMEPIPVTITTANSETTPLEITVENKRTKGNLEIVTQTNPEGGPLTGIKYKITEVNVGQDGAITPIQGTEQNIDGNNGTTNPSFAELREIKSGNYKIEQTQVPEGYTKDMPQIVEVPSNGIGYAVFTIEKPELVERTRLVINKQISNADGENATTEDFEKAKLNSNESFEVKITNVETREEYYTFISTQNRAIISGLPEGIYEIEEIYKPKYELDGYYKNSNENAVANQNLNEGESTLTPIEQNEDGKYVFEITNSEEENTVNIVELTIKNKINSIFPFGGQDLKDNYSLVEADSEEIIGVTQTIIYVVDEDGNRIPGAKFKLLDAEGQLVILGTVGKEFTTVSKKLIIKGLPQGVYTLVNTSVPDGYIQPEDKKIMVYDDSVGVARIEIQKNIPRGAVTLSTTYINKYNETKFVPTSKYKVVNRETGEVIKFTKTATGDYIKSNLEDASTVIVVKSGTVNVSGIETGTYDIGLVGISSGYGMKSDFPETVVIEQNKDKNVNVQVSKKSIVQISSGYYNTMYLDENGELWILGSNDRGMYGNGEFPEYNFNEIPNKIEFPNNVRIKNFSQGAHSVAAVDSDGKVWTWGDNDYVQLGNGTNESSLRPICLTDMENNPLYGIEIVEVQINRQNTVALDSEGKVWTWGNSEYNGYVKTSENPLLPECITNLTDNPLYDAFLDGIKITKLAKECENGSTSGAIDSLGRVWIWGNNNYGQSGKTDNIIEQVPVCVSDLYEELAKARIIELSVSNHVAAVDSDGNVWTWGDNYNGELGNGTTDTTCEPTKLTGKFLDISLNKEVRINKIAANDSNTYFIDENGKVWSCGDGHYLGNGYNNETYSNPICISDSTDLINSRVEDIVASSDGDNVVVIDNNGVLWGWGDNNYGQIGNTSNYLWHTPNKISVDYTQHLEYNVKFTKIKSMPYGDATFAIDENGKLWGIGYQDALGIKDDGNYTDEFTQIRQLENDKIVDMVCTFPHSIVLTEKGEVYIFGRYFDYGANTKENYSSMLTPLNITDQFGNSKIVDISISRNTGIALDSEGKVWTWGYNSNGLLGIGTTDYNRHSVPICISDDADEELHNVKICKIASNENNIYAIDEQGKLWAWGYKYHLGMEDSEISEYCDNIIDSYQTKPVCISNKEDLELGMAYSSGIKIVDIIADSNYGCYILDNNGKIWTITSQKVTCLSNDTNNAIYNESLKYENYAIEKINSGASYTAYAKDNMGTTWIIDSTGARKITDVYNVPQDITDIADGYLIDGYGQIWKYDLDGSICLNVVDKNPIYGIKMRKILYDGIVEADTDKGEIYVVGSQNSHFLMYSESYIENYLGKEIDYIYNYVGSTLSSSVYIILDKEGNLWTWGGEEIATRSNNYIVSDTPICINKIEGTELYEEYQKGIKLKSIDVYSNSVYAIDSEGRLWSWGNENNGILGYDHPTGSPCCVSLIEGTDLYNAHQADSNFKIESVEQISDEVFKATDSNGKIWIWGKNEYGELGNGTTSNVSSPYCVSDSITGADIVDIQIAYGNGKVWSNASVAWPNSYYNNNVTLILDSNGDMWSSGGDNLDNTDYKDCIVGGILGSNVNKNLFSKIPEVQGIEKFIIMDNRIIGLRVVCAYGENCIYSWGYNEHGELGTGSVTNTSINFTLLNNSIGSYMCRDVYIPTKISEQITINKIINLYGSTYVIDTEGKLWAWGYQFGTPKCLSDDESNVFYGKNIIDFVDGYYYAFKGEDGKYYDTNGTEGIAPAPIDAGEIEKPTKGEVVGKNLIDWSLRMAIDSDGNLYGWSGYDGLYDETPGEPLCITTREISKKSVFQTNKTVINIPITNELYGVRIANIINDKIIKDVNGNYWFFPENGRVINLTQKLEFEISDEDIIDETHIKDAEDKIYSINNNGTLTELTEYTPGETPEYEQVTISGVNVVQNSNYKAIDQDGNLYVWNRYTGGYVTAGETSQDAIKTTANEYVVEPIYSQTSGWSIVKALY